MALCAHCRHAVPGPPVGLCPNCGGDLQGFGRAPEAATPGTAAPPPPPPAPPVGPEAGAGIPWDRRGRIGIFNALAETTWQVLSEPGAFFRAMPGTGGLGSPLVYAVVIGWAGLVASAFYGALFQSIVGSRLATLGGGRSELAPVLVFLESWGGFAVQVVLGPVLVAIGAFVGAGLVHLTLLLLGGGRGGFGVTFGVACYSQAIAVFAIIPFCGTLLVLPYLPVLWVVGLAAGHRVGEGRGYAALVLSVVATCCCLLGLAVVLGGLAGLVGLGGLDHP